jgi:hypothetical protein
MGSRLQPGYTFTATEVLIVRPGLEEWLKLPDGRWTAAVYPNTLGQPKRFVEYSGVTPPPPAGDESVTVTVNFTTGAVHVGFSDGRAGDVTIA